MFKLTHLIKVALLHVFLISMAQAHEWQQLFIDQRIEGDRFYAEFNFDASYAEPKLRDDPNALQPKREWLVKQSRKKQALLKHEAINYLTIHFPFYHVTEEGRKRIGAMYHFPDWLSSPPDFPKVLDGCAYFRVIIDVPLPKEGKLELTTKPEKTPNVVFQSGQKDGQKVYHTIRQGETYVFASVTPKQEVILNTPSQTLSLWKFFTSGFLHVLPKGLDHILFITAICLLLSSGKSLIHQSLLFTLAHCITYALLATNLLQLTPTLKTIVEILIALSIIALIIENFLTKKITIRRYCLIFFFGLIHGMGFGAEFSQGLAEQSTSFFAALIAANLGIEAAQLCIIALCYVLIYKVINRQTKRQQICYWASSVIATISGYIVIERLGGIFFG